jgi:uncharacterized protein YkwD
MRHVSRAAIATTLVVSGLLGGTSASVASSTASKASTGWPCKGALLQPTQANLSRVTAATLCLIEHERHAHRLSPLRSDGSLHRIAAKQAREMVVGDYFGDNSLTGWTPIHRIEISRYARRGKSLSAAQNIGWGTAGLATPAAMVQGWMLSPPHRHIMLTGSYRDIGVGVAPAAPASLTQGAKGATYTVEFAVRH